MQQILRWALVWSFCVVSLLAVSRVSAQQDSEPIRRGSAADAAAQGMLLPEVIATGEGRSYALAHVIGGYDSAEDTAVLRAIGDVQIVGPLDIRFGVTYTPDAPNGDVQPHVGLRLRALWQKQHGIDLAFAAFYRMERFTDDEGLIQGLVSVGRRFDRVGLFGHVSYGQDPEGDDREGDVALAGMYGISQALQLGLESHFRFDLFSDDPKREARDDSEWDLIVGPTLNYSLGPVAFIAQVGLRALETEQVRTGVIALGGVGGSY